MPAVFRPEVSQVVAPGIFRFLGGLSGTTGARLGRRTLFAGIRAVGRVHGYAQLKNLIWFFRSSGLFEALLLPEKDPNWQSKITPAADLLRFCVLAWHPGGFEIARPRSVDLTMRKPSLTLF
jgi:hypothetical protein